MLIIRSISRMSAFAKHARKIGKPIGFVPTMGYLHEGHLSLARAAAKAGGLVVMSIFVNPTQFGPKEDLKAYPRDFKRDRKLAASAGVNVIFYPTAAEMYPAGYSTFIDTGRLGEVMCGAARPGHFKGVATVVAKLFNIVKPGAAYFGQKDAQQVAVIKRMVRDLNMDVEIKVLPTIREKDGLAMSSRNTYLSGDERQDAVVLRQALLKAERLVRDGQTNTRKVIRAMESIVKANPSARVDYISIVDPAELKDVSAITGPSLAALAVYISKTRLIDNIILRP